MMMPVESFWLEISSMVSKRKSLSLSDGIERVLIDISIMFSYFS